MAHKTRTRSAQRVALDNARARSARPSFDDLFDNDWLQNVRNDFTIRHVDLTDFEDRRKYDPRFYSGGYGPPAKAFRGSPRIVIVPQKSKLARLQTYGGRYSYKQVMGKSIFERRTFSQRRTAYYKGLPLSSELDSRVIPHQVGFELPWNVIICVRRERRKQVLFALRRTGAGSGANKRRRNEYSDVRC